VKRVSETGKNFTIKDLGKDIFKEKNNKRLDKRSCTPKCFFDTLPLEHIMLEQSLGICYTIPSN